MGSEYKPIKGVQWLQEIIDAPNRQYGIEVHKHLPRKEIKFDPLHLDAVVLHPEELALFRHLIDFYGELPTSRVYPDTYAATIEQGTMIGNSGMVVTPDGIIIAETASLTGYLDRRCFRMEELANPNLFLEFAGHIKGNVLSAANPNSGYSHHLMESLFSVLWFDGTPVDYIHTATGLNRERMEEFFEALQMPLSSLVSSQPTQFRTADKVSFFAPNSFLLVRKETVELFEEALVKHFRFKGEPSGKLYLKTGVKATDYAKSRVPINEPELSEILLGNGYEAVDPARLALIEKIEMFSQAKETIALSGSGLANPLYFSHPNAKVGVLSDVANIAKICVSCIKGRVSSGYSDLPIYPVYPEICHHNGMPLTHWGATFQSSIERYPIRNRISYSIEHGDPLKIQIKRFNEWLEIFSAL